MFIMGIPLTESAFHILLSLSEGERHGYAIGKDVAAVTEGALKLGSATLYRQLRQMLADGWIVEVERSDPDDVDRRYYRLTSHGRRVLRAEAERLRNLVRVAVHRRVLAAGMT